jgi:S-DNA-T family DNA segregation ATPase FtsK/SpoIIIE
VGINKTAQNRLGVFSSYFLLLYWLLLFLLFTDKKIKVPFQLTNRSETVQNWLGKFGFLSDLIVYKGFGLASFLFVIFFLTGILILGISANKLKGIWFWDYCYYCFVCFIWFFCYLSARIRGTVGYELNLFLQDYIGKTGNSFDFDFGLIIYVIF